MSRARIRTAPYQSPLASFLARADVRAKMQSNALDTNPTIGRTVFNNQPACDYLQSLFDVHKELGKNAQPNLDNLEKSGADLSSSDTITSFNSPDMNAWIEVVWAKAMLDLFDINGNLRTEIRIALEEFAFEKQFDIEEIKNKLFIGYLMHIGAYVIDQTNATYYDLIVSQAFQQKVEQHKTVVTPKSIKEIRENISASLFHILDVEEIQSRSLKQHVKATLVSIFVSEYHEENENYLKAYKELRAQIIHEADNDSVTQPVLAEVKRIYDDIDLTEPNETVKKIKLLTEVLNATAQTPIDIAYYNNLMTEVSEHAWGKRLGAAMSVVPIAAMIAACVVLSIATAGVAIPILTGVGFATLLGLSITTGLVASGSVAASARYLLWEGFKHKPIEDAMNAVRDKGKDEVIEPIIPESTVVAKV